MRYLILLLPIMLPFVGMAEDIAPVDPLVSPLNLTEDMIVDVDIESSDAYPNDLYGAEKRTILAEYTKNPEIYETDIKGIKDQHYITKGQARQYMKTGEYSGGYGDHFAQNSKTAENVATEKVRRAKPGKHDLRNLLA